MPNFKFNYSISTMTKTKKKILYSIPNKSMPNKSIPNKSILYKYNITLIYSHYQISLTDLLLL